VRDQGVRQEVQGDLLLVLLERSRPLNPPLPGRKEAPPRRNKWTHQAATPTPT